MRRISIGIFKKVEEPLEIHWLVGFDRCNDGSWLVRAVTRGLTSNGLKIWQFPIGMLPLLSPGLRFETGELLESQSSGEIQAVIFSNLADGVEVTSADMPSGLYSFFGRPGGVQRLIRYKIDVGEVYVPTIELVRYLLVHNKTLANALMTPGKLMTLYHFHPVGTYEELSLLFTADMPVRALSREFALEFAWLAIHPEGRRTWDSVYAKSVGREYVGVDLPNVPGAKMVFRGVARGAALLVLEILHLGGREPPCERLRYGHPRFQRAGGPVIFVDGCESAKSGQMKGCANIEIQVPDDGTRIGVDQPAVNVGAKCMEFTIEVPIEKLWIPVARHRALLRQTAFPSKGRLRNDAGAPMPRHLVKRAVGIEKTGAGVTPLEFRTLEAYPWDDAEELQALADAVSIMAGLVAETEISMAICRLKSGRAFSTIGRRPRCCLVIHVRVVDKPPIVLIDVDRGGEHALSTMALTFIDIVSFADIEADVKKVLDRLVDNGGHWDRELDSELHKTCTCARLPKVLPERWRNESRQFRTIWALRLATKLGLPLNMLLPTED